VGLSLICLGFFVTHSIASTTVSQTATHHKGSASSLYLVAYYLGVSMGTTLLAPLWENFNWTGIILLTGSLPAIYVIIVKLSQATLKSRKAASITCACLLLPYVSVSGVTDQSIPHTNGNK